MLHFYLHAEMDAMCRKIAIFKKNIEYKKFWASLSENVWAQILGEGNCQIRFPSPTRTYF